jgi:hypothetical protein
MSEPVQLPPLPSLKEPAPPPWEAWAFGGFEVSNQRAEFVQATICNPAAPITFVRLEICDPPPPAKVKP